MNELKSSQEMEVARTLESHEDYMERAKNRFETQKAKLEA
jgi:hypothetical protein